MSLEEDLKEYIDRIKQEIIENREEILTAFLAKYGYNADEVVQVVDFSDYTNGIIRWRVERRKNGDTQKTS
jgi:hypothetical protein